MAINSSGRKFPASDVTETMGNWNKNLCVRSKERCVEGRGFCSGLLPEQISLTRCRCLGNSTLRSLRNNKQTFVTQLEVLQIMRLRVCGEHFLIYSFIPVS